MKVLKKVSYRKLIYACSGFYWFLPAYNISCSLYCTKSKLSLSHNNKINRGDCVDLPFTNGNTKQQLAHQSQSHWSNAATLLSCLRQCMHWNSFNSLNKHRVTEVVFCYKSHDADVQISEHAPVSLNLTAIIFLIPKYDKEPHIPNIDIDDKQVILLIV